VQGLESLSIPPWQNKDARPDHDGDPFVKKATSCKDHMERDFNSPSDQPIAKRVSADLASGYSSAKHCYWWQSLSIFVFVRWLVLAQS